MYIKRRIVLDSEGGAIRFDIVMYPSFKVYSEDPSKGTVIGFTSWYEKAEKLEMLFNEVCNH